MRGHWPVPGPEEQPGSIPDRLPVKKAQGVWTGFRQAAASSVHRCKLTLPVCRKGETSQNIVGIEFRKIGKNRFVGLPCRQHFQHIVDCYSEPANTRFAAALAWLGSDTAVVIHARPLLWIWLAILLPQHRR